MSSLVIVGAQWGDEGKGKITDLLCEQYDYVIRYQGGNNAGHTIIVNQKKIILHLIPSGILHKTCTSIMAHGMAVDLESFISEISTLRENGVTIDPGNLKISPYCSLITPYHKLLDTLRESSSHYQKIGTTQKGIGPCYEDKTARVGLQLQDLRDHDLLLQKLKDNFKEKETLFDHLYKTSYPSIEEVADKLFTLGRIVLPYLEDTFLLMVKAIEDKKKLLYEGAQGVLLDLNYGTYPHVTSSNTSLGGVYTGAGSPEGEIKNILGVVKAYTTRVGQGPFPTEIHGSLSKQIQNLGKEFGATTGRLRRCGWLDLPLLKYACKVSNITTLTLTKVDILILLNLPFIQVCTHYKYRGMTLDSAYQGLDLNAVEPIYKNMTSFKDNFKSDTFSKELEEYLSLIERSVGVPVERVAYGAERSQIKNYRSLI